VVNLADVILFVALAALAIMAAIAVSKLWKRD
jgi:hypothetical protein